ncbi:MAG: hypothetical protein AAF268_09475 [Cyanobacteria bacterium P01_A01_bin.3]
MGNSRYSLLELQKRYLSDLDELMRWLMYLDIQVYPSSDGVDRHGQIDAQDMSILDALNRHLVAGGKLENFPGAMLPDVLPHHELSRHPGDRLQVPPHNALASRSAIVPSSYSEENIEASLSVPQLRQRFEFLDDCAARLWLLTTGQVCSITGLKPNTLLSRVKSTGDCQWQSWSFSRAGRQGRESLWKVSNPRISSAVAIEMASAQSRANPQN